MNAPLFHLNTDPQLIEQVHKALLHAICDGTLPPGKRVTPQEIAARLRVSLQAVQQAMLMLQHDGLVLPAAGVSPYFHSREVLIAPLDAEMLTQVVALRGSLDALAARLAADKHTIIDPEILARGRRASKGKSIKAMIDADVAFHEAIYQACDNALIASSAHAHWHHIRRAMGAVLQTTAMRLQVWDEHQGIANAIAQGQADLAEQLVLRHGQVTVRQPGAAHLAAKDSTPQTTKHNRPMMPGTRALLAA